MAAKKPKRTPVGKSKKPKRPAKSTSKSPKIRVDPIKEYRETIQKDGIVEVITLADEDCLAHVKLHISTQSLELDRILNGKGIPTGRVTELFGPFHIGKSTVLDHIFAEVQRMGGIAALADTEGARDIKYTRAIGVDVSKLLYLEFPRRKKKKDGLTVYEEQLHLENVFTKLLETIEFFSIRYPDIPIVLGLDALAGTATKDELANRLTKDEKPADAAKTLRKVCRLLPQYLGNTNIALVICNHEYTRINMGGGVGVKKETYGGDGIRHYASIRLQLHPVKDGWIKKSDGTVLGRIVGVRAVKNRLGNPYVEGQFALLSGAGINNVWNVFMKFKAAKIIVTSGSWSTLNLAGEIIKFQGWYGLFEKCQADPALFGKLVSVYQAIP